MDKIISWQGVCLDCGHKIQSDTEMVAMGEAILHKMKTGHRLLLQGQVEEVRECGRIAIGKLV
jgi:hypothetical protein